VISAGKLLQAVGRANCLEQFAGPARPETPLHQQSRVELAGRDVLVSSHPVNPYEYL